MLTLRYVENDLKCKDQITRSSRHQTGLIPVDRATTRLVSGSRALRHKYPPLTTARISPPAGNGAPKSAECTERTVACFQISSSGTPSSVKGPRAAGTRRVAPEDPSAKQTKTTTEETDLNIRIGYR